MKLRSVEIAGFRGFNDPQEVELDGDLIIISGENHTGKTSLAEALEWLFFGYTCRCHRGKDRYSKAEYKGTYRNIHYPEDEPTYVQLEAVHENNLLILRRELLGDEDSQAYLDRQAVQDFTSLGFSFTASHPIIAQHGLRDFIYTNPNTRREILSYVLGLDSLIKLEQDIKDANTKYKRRRLKDCDTYDRLLAEARQLGLLGNVIDSLEAGSLQKAREGLVQEIRGVADVAELPESMIPETLSQMRAKKEAEVLNLKVYQPADDIALDKELLKKTIEPLNQRFSQSLGRLADFVRASSDKSEAKRVRFIQLGLELVLESEHPEICPFCGQGTLTDENRKAYTELVERFEDPTQISQQIDNDLTKLASAWGDIIGGVNNVIPDLPQGEDLSRIRQLLAGRPELAEYEEKLAAIVEQKNTLSSLCQEGSLSIERARHILKESSYDGDFFEQSRQLPTRLEQCSFSLLKCLFTYVEQFSKIRPVLEVRISSTEEVRALLLLQDFWNRWPEVVKAIRYSQLESKFRSLQKKARSFIADKQKERLEEKEKDILQWYEMLNPEEDVTFKRINVTKTALRLLGQSYGKEIEAPPNFSQSQINCLGLAVYLVQALSVGDLGFVVLDDPVQSMDEAHSERLKMDVIDRLLDTGHQVIVLTHLDNFAENLALTHRRHFPYRIEFTSYSQVGPCIEHKPPRLEDYLDQAREYKTGNAERRRQSSRCLRMAVERITKMLYQRATGSLPAKYQRASFPLLRRKVLTKCDQLSPREADGIRATYDFVVCFPHDDMVIEPPTPEQLEPHISRLEQLSKQHLSS